MQADREDFLDRVKRQQNWNLSLLSDVTLAICGHGRGMMRTLSLAAVSSGIRNLVIVGERRARKALIEAAEDVMCHLGGTAYVPVYSYGLVQGWGVLTAHRKWIWLIDAGDAANDVVAPAGEPAYFYAQCRVAQGGAFLAVGTDREMVARCREGGSPADRAELPAACSQLLIGILADLGVCHSLEPLPPYCQIPLPDLPAAASIPSSAILYAGGGGAIAHQIIWAESLDPVLREANHRGRFVVVDPKYVHESCRSRQWGYPPAALQGPKAPWTAKWIKSLFPGVTVSYYEAPLSRNHFCTGPLEEAVSSMDNWAGRKQLAAMASEYGLSWWSAGTSFFGGFARQVSAKNPFCASAYEGVERLGERSDDQRGPETSCSAAATPLPSSVLPQMLVGSYIACQRRAVLLGQADAASLARGIEVHMEHGSCEPGYEGLRWSPGRRLNLKR